MTQERRTGWEEADKWFAPSARGTGGTPAPEDGETAPEPRCAVCGADLEPDQTYCMECGSPTPLAPRLRRGSRNLLILAGAAAILGLGAGALAFAVANDDDGGSTGTTPTALTSPTSPLVPLPPETGPPTGPLPPDTSFTVPTAPDTTFTTPTTPTTGFDTVTGPGTDGLPPIDTGGDTSTDVVPPPVDDPTTDPDTGGGSDWPPGETAWTAILSSVRSEGDARAAKERVAATGEPAGVLFSSDFPDLQPGYWVVFSGTYQDRGEAIAQATLLRPDFPGAYARQLSG
ncbi:MAG: SPOR domain-containing protein [Thermoleophilia bacterium]